MTTEDLGPEPAAVAEPAEPEGEGGYETEYVTREADGAAPASVSASEYDGPAS